MTQLQQKTKTQRKTFTIPNYIVQELEAYAKSKQIKQSQIISLAIEEYIQKHNNKVKNRLEALESLVGIAPKGKLKNIDLKKIRVQHEITNA